MSESIGIIAGSGQFPRLVAEDAKAAGYGVVVCAFHGFTDPGLEALADAYTTVYLGQFDKVIDYFRKHGVRRLCMAGAINKPRALDLGPDFRAARILFSLRGKGDDALLRAIMADLEKEGFTLIQAAELSTSLLCPEGVLTRRGPSAEEIAEIDYGWPIAEALGRFDIGQCIVVKQGMVVAVAPGNSAREMAEQVAKPLEEYIFSYNEVKKEKTFSQSRDGIVYIQVQLNDDINDKDAFWSKFKHGVATFKSQLPDNVLALQVLDDFGETSALLIAMESDDKTYRELNEYMDRLQDRLRLIPSVGRMTVSGMQKEQISVYVDNARLTKYGLSDRMLAAKLMQKGFATSGGRLQTDVQVQPVYVARSLNAVRDVEQMVVYADPKGNIVRLKDVARVAREYPKADSYITYNGKKCLLLSVEMKKGQDIVKMGNDVNRATEEFRSELPSDVGIYRITDQSRVVSDSVATFLR